MSQSKPGRSFFQKLREIRRIAGAISPIPIIKKDQQQQEEPTQSRFEAVHTPDRLTPGRPTPTEEECLAEIRKWHTLADKERGYILDSQVDPRDPTNPPSPLRESRGRRGLLGRENERVAKYEFSHEDEEHINERYQRYQKKKELERNTAPRLPTPEPPGQVTEPEPARPNPKRDTFGFPEDDTPDYTDFPTWIPPRPPRPDEDMIFTSKERSLPPADMSIRTTGFPSHQSDSPLLPSPESNYDGRSQGLPSEDSSPAELPVPAPPPPPAPAERPLALSPVSSSARRCSKCGDWVSAIEVVTHTRRHQADRGTIWPQPSQLKGKSCERVFPWTTSKKSPTTSPRSPPLAPLSERVCKKMMDTHGEAKSENAKAAEDKRMFRRARLPKAAVAPMARLQSERERVREQVGLRQQRTASASGVDRTQRPEVVPKYERWQTTGLSTRPQRPRREDDDADVLYDIYKSYESSSYI
ncbi:hypothetical protein B0T14DRAFT_108307 [Immersiella caudata]|uniref:Uncharacterized protein n=1 Tax=Immersiella caudata TaxID=314043 RepID=A0AA39X3C8_9PEZI|nr:hypothetical protein B0T14DRAFT_108307 [Immersiella caudata]